MDSAEMIVAAWTILKTPLLEIDTASKSCLLQLSGESNYISCRYYVPATGHE